MKVAEMLALLQREPLSYRVVRSTGSHLILRSQERPQLVLAFHAGRSIPPHLVRDILVHEVGLGYHEAILLLKGR